MNPPDGVSEHGRPEEDARTNGLGLHSSGLLGPRMGSVTYRVLCLARTLVLALPPVPAASGGRPLAAFALARTLL